MDAIFSDRLLSAIQVKGTPICVGIDPQFESLPDAVIGRADRSRNGNDARAAVDAIFDFTTTVLRVVAPLVPCVKFQSAYFEKYLADGVEAYFDLVQEAHELGLIVIGDVKRGDIGSTSEAYAAAHLSGPAFADDDVALPDAITVNPMLGFDTLQPFVEGARQTGKGLFVLVRTSNPGSGQLQDAALADGRTWSEMLADGLAPIADGVGLVGAGRFSSIGAVVGATQPATMQSLRRRLPKSIFLLPGYGAQGATAEMTRAAFVDGRGALISASRSLLYAHRDPKHAGGSWELAVESAVLAMRQDLFAAGIGK